MKLKMKKTIFPFLTILFIISLVFLNKLIAREKVERQETLV